MPCVTNGRTRGIYKTYWQIAARYWWPKMQKDICEMTLGCGHCRAANIASHKAQQKLTAFATDAPFNTIAMDIWHPGAITSSKHRHKHVLIATCLMTTFVLADLVTDLTAETITPVSYTHLTLPTIA